MSIDWFRVTVYGIALSICLLFWTLVGAAIITILRWI